MCTVIVCGASVAASHILCSYGIFRFTLALSLMQQLSDRHCFSETSMHQMAAAFA